MRPSNDREAITLVLEGITKAGCVIKGVIEDTWCPDDITFASDVTEAAALVTGVDEAYVHIQLPDNERAWIRFVLGNDPEEVVCDHTVNLSKYIDPITNPWWE